MQSKEREQHIAVFGESGSGKTVMVSSFYGGMQEPQYLQKSLFHVVADDIGQGARLHRNYLGMGNSAQPPGHTRFSATSYSFSVKLKEGSDAKAIKARPFDALRLVWHDYPGEWFQEDVSGPEEERYLKSLLANVRNGLLSLKDDLLEDGKPLVEFPRIWIMALSKADLLPNLDVSSSGISSSRGPAMT